MKSQLQQNKKKWNILEVISWTTSYLESNNIESPRICSEMLLAYALNLTRIDLYLKYDQPLKKTELEFYKSLIKRRIENEPVAYIIGQKGFWTMDFFVSRDVLIPRPETEILVETAISLIPSADEKKWNILDIGTGSGAIILSIASEKEEHSFFASDISYNALKIAKKNAAAYGLGDKIFLFCNNLFEAITNVQYFDMIVSNPPYISSKTINSLQPEIKFYEPITALDGDEDGLSFIRKIINQSELYLKPNGYLIMEIGYDQKESVIQITNSTKYFNSIEFIKDYSGHFRVVKLKKNNYV
ncbi:MAG: peptide chain release factor N(5)-glutamine methyltransferase [Desulfobacterales bacterium]|nr:peptide chain release factor N(5)-glutamine methyltransferase [Desulfobacterales bacterium]